MCLASYLLPQCYHLTFVPPLPCYHFQVTWYRYHVTNYHCYHVTMLPCYHLSSEFSGTCYHVTFICASQVTCYLTVTMLPVTTVTMLPGASKRGTITILSYCYHVTMLSFFRCIFRYMLSSYFYMCLASYLLPHCYHVTSYCGTFSVIMLPVP